MDLFRGRRQLAQPTKLAILLAMNENEQTPLAQVKNKLSEVVDRIEREHGRVVITKHGRAAAVILSVEDLESLEETLTILSNPDLMAEIQEAKRDIGRGRTKRLTRDEADALIRRSDLSAGASRSRSNGPRRLSAH